VFQYKVFKVALLEQWLVVVSGPEMNDELRKVPDSHVSFTMAAEEVCLSFSLQRAYLEAFPNVVL